MRQGDSLALPLLITLGYLTAKSQSVHLSDGIRAAFPDVSPPAFLSVLKKHVTPEHMGRHTVRAEVKRCF